MRCYRISIVASGRRIVKAMITWLNIVVDCIQKHYFFFVGVFSYARFFFLFAIIQMELQRFFSLVHDDISNFVRRMDWTAMGLHACWGTSTQNNQYTWFNFRLLWNRWTFEFSFHLVINFYGFFPSLSHSVGWSIDVLFNFSSNTCYGKFYGFKFVLGLVA